MFCGTKFKTRDGKVVTVIDYDEENGLYLYWDKAEGIQYERVSYIISNKIEQDKK